MPVGTFKNKLSDTQTQYKFTEDEQNRLFEVLRELSGDIEQVAGMTFNQALKQIVKK